MPTVFAVIAKTVLEDGRPAVLAGGNRNLGDVLSRTPISVAARRTHEAAVAYVISSDHGPGTVSAGWIVGVHLNFKHDILLLFVHVCDITETHTDTLPRIS